VKWIALTIEQIARLVDEKRPEVLEQTVPKRRVTAPGMIVGRARSLRGDRLLVPITDHMGASRARSSLDASTRVLPSAGSAATKQSTQ
jgi:hypothetical protein